MRSNLRIIRKHFISHEAISALSVRYLDSAGSCAIQQQEIQQLKDKLEQLDQTMSEVKAQIKALEQRPSVTAASVPAQVPAQIVEAQKSQDQDSSSKPEIHKFLADGEAREQSAALKPMLEESTGPALATSVRERAKRSN